MSARVNEACGNEVFNITVGEFFIGLVLKPFDNELSDCIENEFVLFIRMKIKDIHDVLIG